MPALISKIIAGGLAAVIVWIIYYSFTASFSYLIKKITGKKNIQNLQNGDQTNSSQLQESQNDGKAIVDLGKGMEKELSSEKNQNTYRMDLPLEEENSLESNLTNENNHDEELSNVNMSRLYDVNQPRPLSNGENQKNMPNNEQNKKYIFSKKHKICLVIQGIIALMVVAAFFHLQKYDIHSWGCRDIYNASIILAVIAFILILLLWWICRMQVKGYKVWRIYTIRTLNILTCMTTLTSLGLMISTLSSHEVEIAKEDYEHNEVLRSSDIKIVNEELIRRFEQKGSSLSWNYSTQTWSDPSDKDFFSVLNLQAQNNNGVAQGILGEFYFQMGRSLIRESKKRDNHIAEERLYKAGRDNIERAYYWWLKAAENEDPRGMYRIGDCYAKINEVDGITKDLEKAYYYWGKAANKGFGMAYKRLGDLFGTWDYLGGFQVCLPSGIGNDTVTRLKGIDRYYKNGEEYFSKPFPLPKEWKHDIKKAREYWEEAVKCGGLAETEARERLEKIYPEEK